MMHRLTSSLLCAATVLTCCGQYHPPAPVSVKRTVITSPLVDNALDFLYFTIAQRAHLEAWFCLRGFVDPATENVIVQNLSPVFVDSADGMNIHGRPAHCASGPDSSSIIGTVHFHPDLNECEFSDMDIVTAHWLGYKTEAIVCRDNENPTPHLKLIVRSQVDSAFAIIAAASDSTAAPITARVFTPVYRYIKKP